jgi:hypothetical protein
VAEGLKQRNEIGQSLEVDERLKLEHDITTWLAETLDGGMRTKFTFRFNGTELLSREGRCLGEVFDTAIEDAENTAEESPNLLFELERRLIEKSEYREMCSMMKRPEAFPNTMVVISDFPSELMYAKKDIGGYNSVRKQTMLRVLTRSEDGNILTMYSQSLDQSDRSSLEAIYDRFQRVPNDGRLLEQRIRYEVRPPHQEGLIDTLTSIYDTNIAKKFGGSWHAGRSEELHINTYDFVCQQRDLLDAFIDLQLKDPSVSGVQDRRYYALASAMEQRFKNYKTVPFQQYTDNNSTYRDIYNEMEVATSIAVANNRTYSGCGLTMEASQQLEAAGFGNKTSKETSYSFDKQTYCRVCQKPPKPGEPKKMCGPCDICKPCDSHISRVK